MKTKAAFVLMLVGLSSTALAQNFPASTRAPQCAQLKGEAQRVTAHAQRASAEVKAQRAALDQVEARLQQQAAPEVLVELLQVRLTLGERIRDGELALHMARSNAQMVEARLRAAACR